jgi:hypothetical protein
MATTIRKCGLCKREGHDKRNCPTKNAAAAGGGGGGAVPEPVVPIPTGRKCGLCKTPGHIASNCPRKDELQAKKTARAAKRQAKIDALWAMVPDPDPSLPPVLNFADPAFKYPNINWTITSNPVEDAHWGNCPDNTIDNPILPPEIANRPLSNKIILWDFVCLLHYAPLKKNSLMGFLMAIYIGKKYYMKLIGCGDHVFYEGLSPSGVLMLGS